MQITSGKRDLPVKILIYGPEGIGKSTLAAQFPGAVFIDTEGSTARMDVARLPDPSSWTMLMQEVEYIKSHPEECQTLVIDTADWAERLCRDMICAKKQISSLEDLGYGKGYVYVQEEFGRLLNKLSELINVGVNVVMTAHAQMRKFEQPDELGAYDRWELKMLKQTSPMVKEWADAILFCNYKTIVVNVDNKGATKGKNKAQGGRRVIYTSHHPCWDAKNRFGLPEELDMSYDQIAHIIPARITPLTDSAPAMTNAPQVAQQMTLPGVEPEPPVVMAPVPDEDPRQHAPDPKAEAPAASGGNSKPSPYFSDPAKLPKALRDLMEQDGISEWDIQMAVLAKGYYPDGTLIENMDPEFVKGWIIAFWPQVKDLIEQIKKDQTVPFN